MKKLIIAAFAILTGIVANAAAVDWVLTNSYQPGTDTGAENYLSISLTRQRYHVQTRLPIWRQEV